MEGDVTCACTHTHTHAHTDANQQRANKVLGGEGRVRLDGLIAQDIQKVQSKHRTTALK